MCYVVECSSGRCEDHHTWIAGIFPDAIDAEKLKEEIRVKIQISLDKPCPFEEGRIEFLTDEEFEIYDKWWDEKNNASEFICVTVAEYPFGRAVE